MQNSMKYLQESTKQIQSSVIIVRSNIYYHTQHNIYDKGKISIRF